MEKDVKENSTCRILKNNHGMIVTYWPSTQPSIVKQVYRRYQDITLTCGRVEFGADTTLTRSRWMSNNYITRCHRQFELVGVNCIWSSSCNSRQWEPAPRRGLGPAGPPVEQPSRMRKKCCYSQRNFGSICCSLFSLQLTSHTQPFHNPFATLSNKVWEVYFSKEVCSFVIIVDFVSACICIRIVVSRLYNICIYIDRYLSRWHQRKVKRKQRV